MRFVPCFSSVSFLVLLILAGFNISLRASAAFVAQSTGSYSTTKIRRPKRWEPSAMRLWAVSQQAAQQQQRPKRPMLIVNLNGDANTANTATLGATLAMSAFDILTGSMNTDEAIAETPVPPGQPVSWITDADLTVDVLQRQSFASDNDHSGREEIVKPIIHFITEQGRDATGLLECLAPATQQHTSFLGVHTMESATASRQDDGGFVSPDIARHSSRLIQQLWQHFDPSKTALSLDLALLLSMLQANCLPKTETTNGDSFHVLLGDSGGSCSGTSCVVIDYLYDNRFGGTDPLSCPTKEVVVSVSGDDVKGSKDSIDYETPNKGYKHVASASAYSVLRGNGLDAISSACIAASVASILQPENILDSPPLLTALTWPLIQQVVQVSRKLRAHGAVETPGVMRKLYIDCGYK